MSTEQSEPKQKRVVRGKDFKEVAVTSFGLRLNDNLCELLLAYETAAENDEEIVVEQVKAIMTPRTLKTLSQLLTEAMPPFEAALGEIKLPPNKLNQVKKAVEESGLGKHITPR